MRNEEDLQPSVQLQGGEMKKEYQKPSLVCYEDLRAVTMGSSPFDTESGTGGTISPFRRPGGVTSQTDNSTDSYGGGSSEDIFE